LKVRSSSSSLVKTIVISISLLLVFSAFGFLARPSNAQASTPVGFANSNYNFYAYQSSSTSYPTARFDTTVNIQSSLSATGYFTGATEGCSANDLWTYQNNFFDSSGEFIQEVLAVGLTQNTPSCFTIEWGPPGTTQVYNYEATMIPATYTPDFENAGNSLDFSIQGAAGQLPNNEINITSFNLLLNGAQVAILTPSQMLNYSTGQLLNGADGPVFYGPNTTQNFNIVGPGDGQTIVFSSGAGTISYCGSVPNNPPELGGLGGFAFGGGTTVESSNLFYGIPTATTGSCNYAPTAYSQYFNILPTNSSSSGSGGGGSSSGVCDQGASSSGVNINSPPCNTTTSSSSIAVSGNDSLPPGNYAVGQPGQALGFPCNNGNTANPPGCPAEPQLNILSSWISNYNPTMGAFQVNLNMSDLTGLALVSPPAQGQYWSVQWTYDGTTYFAQMDEWLTNVENVTATGITGPMQVSGISFWYGTVSLTEINSGTPAGGLLYTAYNYEGQLSGSYTQSAPGEITMTVPVSDVGSPSAGSTFSNLLATTGQVEAIYANYSSSTNGLQVISSPDTIYATAAYKLGAPLLPDGYVQVTLLPSADQPSSSTTWTTATLVNYPDTNNWQTTLSLSSLTAGTYTIYAREVNNYTGLAGSNTATQFTYAPTVSMSLSPSSATIVHGSKVSTVATITGGVQTVYITVGTLPSGVSVSFSTNPVTNSYSGVKSTITFYTTPKTPQGTYDIPITAIGSDGYSSTATYILTVR
jgi:hypothetical protein